MTAKTLLAAAEFVSSKEIAGLEGRWQVTAAALARQAIELSVDEWLESCGIDPSCCNGREGFLILKALAPDRELAGEVHFAWCRLSDACHAGSYSNPPSADELQRWIEIAGRFNREADSAITIKESSVHS